jgi:hypothetical protein
MPRWEMEVPARHVHVLRVDEGRDNRYTCLIALENRGLDPVNCHSIAIDPPHPIFSETASFIMLRRYLIARML